jgi:minor histocompatibility antigen H13
MSPTSFSTGSLILSALFAYDIWAVFFTPLMVTVAKNLDVPIKLIFPRPGEDRAFSMLGLGDIVIPGIMIAMALRFDLYLFYLKKQKKCEGDVPKSEADSKTAELEVLKAPYIPATGSWGTKFLTRGADPATLPARLTSTFPKVYFTASLIGYTTGLVVTLMAMSISEHPQPALLYLVPGVLSSLWLTSLVRGEATAMWEFSEGLDEDEAEKALAAAKKQTEQPNPADAKDQTTWSWFTREVASFFGSTTTEETTPAAIAAAKQKPYTSTKASSKDDVILSFSVTRAATRPNMPVSTSAGQVAPSQTPEE